MNERIQELARQAGAQHRLNLGVEEFCFEHHELEKFAELIVRECMSITDKCSTGPGIHDLFADEIIAEHFGVEE